jgi:drug/metabolite transporter (DMT)-like permease
MTAVAFVLWYSAVAALGAGPMGLLTGIAPVAAALAGLLTGSRLPGPLVWLGMLIVVAGLVAGLRARPTRAAHPRGAPRQRRPVPAPATVAGEQA